MRRSILSTVAVLVGAASLALGALAFTHNDREIRTEILIAAPPEAVWRVLTTTAEYPEWNPFLVSVQGKLAEDQTLKVTARPPGGAEMSFTARVLTVRRIANSLGVEAS